jgi:hypothetical protein
MAPLMYGISVLSCMSSALSEPGGAGLGTLGLPESRAREMASGRVHPVPHARRRPLGELVLRGASLTEFAHAGDVLTQSERVTSGPSPVAVRFAHE